MVKRLKRYSVWVDAEIHNDDFYEELFKVKGVKLAELVSYADVTGEDE